MAVKRASGFANPFDVTKATDFDDSEIASTWVDFPSGGGFRSLVDPRSPVAKFVLGGKGSGRTHLMRFYSSGLQALRLKQGGMSTLKDEGYVGVYVQSSALNAGRFSNKGQPDEAWNAVFAYYLDLWLSSRLLMAVDELWAAIGKDGRVSDSITESLREELGLPADLVVPEERGGMSVLRHSLRELDLAINDAAVTRELRVTIRSSPGSLLFSAADAVGTLSEFEGLQFALLVDEFESFSAEQQRYVNTLVREKRPRVGFLVGARTFGIKTFETLSGEVNREGSEFETILLDSLHLRKVSDYRRFCSALVAKRLVRGGLFLPSDEEKLRARLDSFFVVPRRTRLGEMETLFVKEEDLERSALSRLEGQLRQFRPFGVTDADISELHELLKWPASPLIEKLAVYLFYKSWHQRENPKDAAVRIHAEASDFAGGSDATSFAEAMGHFRDDMLAQLLRDYGEPPRYLGFSAFVELSGGLPRGLVVILKHIFKWAVFNGEEPFVPNNKISEVSQQAGVREAARWFYQDFPGIGVNGVSAQSAIKRLGDFLSALRFSDKPSESSLCTVAIDRERLSDHARSTVEHCIDFSFLIPIGPGHSDRNTRRRQYKLQLHPTLCPLWDLPTGRRGVVELSSLEASAVFDDARSDGFESILKARLRRMNVPFPKADAVSMSLEFSSHD